MTPDSELLSRYARTRSEDVFAELVRRHVNLVYSAALRQVNGDAHLAQDVAQTVFADLARKAGSLARRESLTGWLYTSAHFAAAKITRTENRRRLREDKFMREPTNESCAGVSPANVWEKIRPALDDAMHELKESDREAVLLRYFENRSFIEVGAKFGLNENAARMRVDRALEKLRAIFTKRGIVATTALASVISANAVQMAPAGLATTLATTSIAAAGTGTAFILLKLMTASQLKLGIGALAAIGAATTLVMQHQAQVKLRQESRLQGQQIAQLATDNQSLSNRLAATADAKSLTDEQMSELLRLRSMVGQMREQTNQLALLQAENRWLQLQMENFGNQALRNYPALTNVFLFEVHRAAMINAGKQIGIALRMHADDYGGEYPTNLSQLIYTTNQGGGYIRTNFSGDVQLADFEAANPGLANERIPQIPAARERQPRWWDGKWERVYVLSDGSVQVITSSDGNFSVWEKAQLDSALGTTNQ